MIIYCISGLGVDERMFRNLTWPSYCDVRYIHWIKPYRNETFAAYLTRLAEQIDTSRPFCFAGLSFGGIVAVEWSKMFHPVHTIIISSTPVSAGVPWYYRIPGRYIPAMFIPVSLFRRANTFFCWLFGAHSAAAKQLLNDVMKDTDPDFLRWAIYTLLRWNNSHRDTSVFHIHGGEDKVLPLYYVKPDIVLEAGTHLMVYTMAADISAVISQRLEKTS